MSLSVPGKTVLVAGGSGVWLGDGPDIPRLFLGLLSWKEIWAVAQILLNLFSLNPISWYLLFSCHSLNSNSVLGPEMGIGDIIKHIFRVLIGMV